MTMGAKPGDTVRVHYRGTFADGTQFDCSEGRDPIEFAIGGGGIIPGFDAAVDGMDVGEKTTVTIEPADAYGERDEDLVFGVDRTQIAGEPVIGALVSVVTPEGNADAVITGIDDEFVELDFNHELAGKALTFELELVEIVEPPAE
jgi:peptidylprolyl isomerase